MPSCANVWARSESVVVDEWRLFLADKSYRVNEMKEGFYDMI